MSKKLSNPFSTGGGGYHFESHVQSSFVVLMLTKGCAPALPSWPIVEIKLQGKVNGYSTDDAIVFVKNPDNNAQIKLLVQIKSTITITKKDEKFSDVLKAAWNDFNDKNIFEKGRDRIALVTGPISKADFHNVTWLLDQARATKDNNDFLLKVKKSNFSPPKADEKLDVFRFHLEKANNGKSITDEELYCFLKDFYLLGYDLGREEGVVLSLIHSHISQYNSEIPKLIWATVVNFVQTRNKSAGSITTGNLPEELKSLFVGKKKAIIPTEYPKPPISEVAKPNINISQAVGIPSAIAGGWDDKNQHDVDILKRLTNAF